MTTDPPGATGVAPGVWAAWRSAPEHVVAEILDGELFTMPRPRPRHAFTAVKLSGRLRPFFDPVDDDPGGWIILMEPELHLGPKPDVLVPDLAGWRRERMPTIPGEAAFTVAPDWVCEVLSPGTEAIDRGRKRRIYRREGVAHLWLASPEDRTLEVYRLENGRWVEVETWEGDAVVRAEPFDAREPSLGALWSL